MSFFDSGALRDGERPLRRRRTWLVLVLFVALAVAGYVGLHRYSVDRVPVGVSVEGVTVGGLPRGEALARLESRLGPRLTTPVEVTYDDHTYRLDAARSGFSLDYAATLREVGAIGDHWSPHRVWDFYTEGGDRPAVVRIDRPVFERALAKLTRRIGRPAVEGTVSFRAGRAVAVHGRSGLAIDERATATLVRSLLFGDHAGELPMTVREPYVSDAMVTRAMHSFGRPAMSEPVDLDLGGRTFVVAPTIFGEALRMVPKNGVLEPLIDPAQLRSVLSRGLRTIGDKPVDATVALRGRRPVVVPAVDGASYDADTLARKFMAALTRTGSGRSVHLHGAITEPRVSTARARSWRVTSPVASVVVAAPASALRALDGRVLSPGDPVAVARLLEPADVSSVSGVFAAALRAGLDVSAIATPARVHADLPDGQQAHALTITAPRGTHWLVTVRRLGDRLSTLTLWGRPQPRIRLTTGPHTAVTAPSTTHDSSPDCVPRAGASGYTVTVRRNGPGSPHAITSTYQAVPRVVCGPSPTSTSSGP